MASRTGSSSSGNHRASFAVLAGILAVLAVPVAVELAHRTKGLAIMDAAWAIPVAAALGVAALLFARGARGRIARTLERSGGRTRARAGRWLAVAGICFALSGSIAVGFYEVLLRLEK